MSSGVATTSRHLGPSSFLISLLCLPASCFSCALAILATALAASLSITTLPALITKDDIDDEFPLMMYPGEIEATRKFIFTNMRKGLYRTNILAFFDRRELIDAVGNNERFWLDVTGRLTTGQYFYGQRRILIINRRNNP